MANIKLDNKFSLSSDSRQWILSENGTKGYLEMGCFDCLGYDEKCQSYISPKSLYEKGLERGKND